MVSWVECLMLMVGMLKAEMLKIEMLYCSVWNWLTPLRPRAGTAVAILQTMEAGGCHPVVKGCWMLMTGM